MNKLNKYGMCALCGAPLYGLGNNAEPLSDGRCCDHCNTERVIPARMAVFMKGVVGKEEEQL